MSTSKCILKCNLVLVLLTIVNSHKACVSFNNIFMQLKDRNNEWFNQTVNGCIERIEFGERTVTEAYIKEQSIPILSRDSVRNMVRLDTVSFWKCDLRSVLPFAFRQVPRLKNVQFSYCRLKEITKGVFNNTPTVEVLRFDNNQLELIENQAFENLTMLKKLYANNNKLTEWKTEWFNDTASLEIIDFQNNQISSIPSFAFAKLKHLIQIYFDFNEIENIQPQAFEGLTFLEYLGLRKNRLKVLNENVFPSDIKIQVFVINANYLNFISNDVFKKLSVKEIILDFNPWKCQCLDNIRQWLKVNNASLKTADNCNFNYIPVCAFPKSFSNTCLEYADDEMTQRYFGAVKYVQKPINKDCIRLD